MRSYQAARSLFSFLGLIAWLVIIAGIIAAMAGAGGGSQFGGAAAGMFAMAPGIGIVIAGFFLLAFVQMGRASVDTAEYGIQTAPALPRLVMNLITKTKPDLGQVVVTTLSPDRFQQRKNL